MANNNQSDFDMTGINFKNTSQTEFGYRQEDRSAVAATKGWTNGQNLLIAGVALALVLSFLPRSNGSLKINNYNSGDGTKIEHRQR